ncbi:DUF1295 domain-containing protein [Streptomyces chumphonensis]|uniref:DUF1295 domain-containing protein n=1 Tax=Streptomyces chumphonensis TaxID=1214925 RepID=UPI003D764B92
MNGFPWGDFALNLAFAAGSALAVMLVTFAVAVVRGMHRIVDVAWGLGFTAVALTSYVLSSGQGDDGRRLLVTVLTAVWGLRLAGHIALRGRGKGEDPRYDRMLSKAPPGTSRNAYAFRMVYLLQGGLVWLVSLPVQAVYYVPSALGLLAVLAALVWLTGLFFEAVGDRQLARFTSDPANKGRIMDRGLWSWTRHPNYFGDFCVWWGLYLLAAPGGWAVAAATLVSPVVMSLLLTKGSGKRLLEAHMAERPGYAEYAARTSGFFPLPPRRRR